MMKRLNKVTLLGNLGNEPEIKSLQGDFSVAKVSLATSESFRDKEGVLQTETEWKNIVARRKLANFAGKFLQKGSRVYWEGKLKTRFYEDKSGNKKYITEIIADSFVMPDKGSDKAEINASSQ